MLKQRNPLDLKSRKSVSILPIGDLIFDHFGVKADKPGQERPIPSQSITNISLKIEATIVQIYGYQTRFSEHINAVFRQY